MVTPQYVVAFSKNYTSNRGSGAIVSIEKIARSGASLRGRSSEVGRSVPTAETTGVSFARFGLRILSRTKLQQ